MNAKHELETLIANLKSEEYWLSLRSHGVYSPESEMRQAQRNLMHHIRTRLEAIAAQLPASSSTNAENNTENASPPPSSDRLRIYITTIPEAAMSYQLCYVMEGIAWFASVSPELVDGDDWNDIPYEHNAETPYDFIRLPNGEKQQIDLYKVHFEARYEEPANGFTNSRWSVDLINAGAVAWLTPCRAGEPVIPAGTTLKRFCQIMAQTDGIVYVPLATMGGERGD